jgi:hypothetical protein
MNLIEEYFDIPEGVTRHLTIDFEQTHPQMRLYVTFIKDNLLYTDSSGSQHRFQIKWRYTRHKNDNDLNVLTPFRKVVVVEEKSRDNVILLARGVVEAQKPVYCFRWLDGVQERQAWLGEGLAVHTYECDSNCFLPSLTEELKTWNFFGAEGPDLPKGPFGNGYGWKQEDPPYQFDAFVVQEACRTVEETGMFNYSDDGDRAVPGQHIRCRKCGDYPCVWERKKARIMKDQRTILAKRKNHVSNFDRRVLAYRQVAFAMLGRPSQRFNILECYSNGIEKEWADNDIIDVDAKHENNDSK